MYENIYIYIYIYNASCTALSGGVGCAEERAIGKRGRVGDGEKVVREEGGEERNEGSERKRERKIEIER